MSTAKVLSSYRALLRASRTWHYDPARADRSLGNKMKEQIQAKYRENRNITDTNTVSTFYFKSVYILI